MGERAIITYPATGIHFPVANIAASIAKSILRTFPIGIIPEDNYHVDTRTGMKDYRRGTNGAEGMKHLERPRLLVSTNPISNPDEKNAGFGSTARMKYPSQYIDQRIIGHGKMPIYKDDLGIVISTIQIRRKMTMDFVFEVNSAADQESVRNLIYNTFKIDEMDYFYDLSSDIIMPAIMIKDLKKILYSSSNETNQEAVLEDFRTRLKNYSEDSINFLRLGDNDDRTFVVYNQIWNKVAFVVQEPTINEGEKINKADDLFTVEFSMEIETTFPNTYIINSPSMLTGNTIVGNYVFKSGQTDLLGNMHVIDIPKNQIDTASRGLKEEKKVIIYSEEFFMAGETDTIYVKDFIPDLWKNLFTLATPDERKKIFDVDYYEGDYFVNDNYIVREYTADDIIHTISNCDVKKNYIIEIFVDTSVIKVLFDLIMKRGEVV